MDLQNQFIAEARSLLLVPSEHSWKELCGKIDMFEARVEDVGMDGDKSDLFAVAIDYLEEHLKSWPDELLIPPATWIGSASIGEVSEAFRLVCCFRFCDDVHAESQELHGILENKYFKNTWHQYL